VCLLVVTSLIESTISCGEAFLNMDQSKAMVQLTNGAAKLVPLNCLNPPPAETLVMFVPGAINPFFAKVGLIFEEGSGFSSLLQATTGITHGLPQVLGNIYFPPGFQRRRQ
jgi:hypothetical protein